jgi:small subunit ribosomal protein S2
MTGKLSVLISDMNCTNSRSLRCIQVIAGVLGRAGEAGQKQRLAAAAQGRITYRPTRGLVMPGTEGDEGAATSTAEGTQTRQGAALSEDIVNTDELEKKLDEVNNQEDHRLKGGRELKATS